MGLPGLGYGQLDPAVLHEEVFAESYRRLSVYHVDPVSLSALVPKGLEKLNTLNPSANIPQILASLPAPGPEDWQGWAHVTMQTVAAAKITAPPDQIYSAILPGIMGPLDDFSHYIPPEDSLSAHEWRSGYGGIGVTFEKKDNRFVILDVFIGSPAEKAGLLAGEIAHAINGQDLATVGAKDFATLVRGEPGTQLTLLVGKEGAAPRPVTLTRERVVPTTVALTMKGDMAVIRISRFEPATVNEFRNAARQAQWNHAKAVVLDLQHNPGGNLNSATAIAALLVPEGAVAETRGRHPAASDTYTADGTDILIGLPLVVLMDGHSASASEVLAAALHDRHRARLVGSASFGKGTVQNVAPLPNGGELAVTWARLLPPSGQSFIGRGLQPDICLPRPVTPCPKADDIRALALPAAEKMVN
jgi:carboxyl-terminal processing protease